MEHKKLSIWSHKFVVRSFQIGGNNALSLPALFGILQEGAWGHAIALGFGYEEMIKYNLVWVLSRLKVKIVRLPTWREEIFLRTWVVEMGRMLSRREFEILDTNGRRIIAAVTMWALLDIKAKKPVMLDTIDFGFPYRPKSKVMEEVPEKLPIPERSRLAGTYRVRYSDIDMNGHMNNIHYIRVVMDSYPIDWLKTHLPEIVEVNYRAEARLNDELIIKTSAEEDVFLHQVIHRKDDRPVALVKINWGQI